MDAPNHPSMFWRIGHFDALVPLSQSQPAERLGVARLAVKATLHQRHFEFLVLLRHIEPQVVISVTVLPRLAAISSGDRMRINASSVARTTLMGFRDP